MKYIIHKKKGVKECDGMVSGDFGIPVYPDADAPIGMGPVNPRGGPDRWEYYKNIHLYQKYSKMRSIK